MNNFAIPPTPSSIDPIVDLVASTKGALPGTVNLAWTEPHFVGAKGSRVYDIRISTTGQMYDNPDFNTRPRLSYFTSVAIPQPGPGGNQALLAVSGLQPGVTYYFGVREYDSSVPAKLASAWRSNSNQGWNVSNFASPKASVDHMDPILDLAASTAGANAGIINLAWTEPGFKGTSGQRSYDIRVSTAGEIASDFDFASAARLSSFVNVPLPQPGQGGARVQLAVSGLQPGVTSYFAIREYDSSSPPIVGSWTQDLGLGVNVNNAAAPYVPAPVVSAVMDLSAALGAAEGDILATWTVPTTTARDGLQSFDLRYGTSPVAVLDKGAESWFATAPYRVIIATVVAVGSPQSYLIHGLFPDTTWYFAIKSISQEGDISPVDLRAWSNQAHSLPRNLPPATPHGVAAAAGMERANVSWMALLPAQKGLDFAYYRVLRSTQAAWGFVSVATTTALSISDLSLKPFTTYYYELSARDQGGLESAPSTAVAVAPYSIAPMAPGGIRTELSDEGSRAKFTWLPVSNFMDGTPFASLSAPTADELEGYRILRSTTICAPNYVLIATVPASGSAYTDFTRGDIYYYQIQSYNSAGASSATAVVSGTGEQSFFLEDCRSRVVISDAQSAALNPATNGLGIPISIERRARPEDCGAGVAAAAEFNAVPRGGAPIKYFHFDKPAQVVLHYPGGAAAAAPDKAMVASGSVAMYWYNGREYRQIYAKVDTAAQTVTALTPNLGLFEVRPQASAGGAFAVSGRIITPNGDGRNDLLIISYVPGPDTAVVSGKIYDLKGGYVADMLAGLEADTLTWDGKMNGRAVVGGVYAYEIKGGGKNFTGTVVVAR